MHDELALVEADRGHYQELCINFRQDQDDVV